MIVFGQISVCKPIMVQIFALFQCFIELLVSRFSRHFHRELRKKCQRTYIGSEKKTIGKRVFADFSKTNKPIGINLVTQVDILD